ncbi:MAG: DNA replication/repair protein RecF [Blastocatellia bacterium]|nr:DNA replication/repair protein RecF [Blastocatellia bacterium]MCS7156969.1 DNA replication/repair protein RecF [Blastocatellia bacterium]MCX7752170.1 DNA replication/repair protein RecF [Blastocatellia bacterium]MDW8167662.1 DNA replication/repair protein RecF [Acidobacteriota bacterium]MDW8256261.1 DNA replication/repair protein RecF [Acidobacteriota bacterium]
MRIVRLEVVDFRNIAEERWEPGPGLNFLYGENAQGKTSLLEALYVLGHARSFRTPRLLEVIRHGQPQAFVRGIVERRGTRVELAVQLNPRTRALFVNGKRRTLSEYLGHLVVFVCSLERMDVIRGEPEHRRRFLDEGLLSLDPKYAHTLEQYQRVLKQKNRLLKLAAESDDPRRFLEEIEVWNEQLVHYGALIHRARTRYVELLQRHLPADLFGSEQIAIRYVSSLAAHGDVSEYEKLLAERLRVRLTAELALGHALVGPHRDELAITFEGRELRHYGSLGQQRSALIVLDLAQVSVYNFAFEEEAVFLLDDVDAELDRRRIARVLEYLQGRAQCFLTTSKPDIAAASYPQTMRFRVEAGHLIPIPPHAQGDEVNRSTERAESQCETSC